METKTSQVNDYQKQLKNYEKNISDIYKERKKLIKQINQKSKQKKFFNLPQYINKYKDRKSQTQINDTVRKMVKKDSQAIDRKVSQTENNIKSQNNIQQNSQTKKTQKATHVPQAIADRNRRIFGGLTSYLKKAGEQLQSKQFKQKQQHSKQIMNKYISKQKQQRQELQRKKKQQLQTQLTNLVNMKKQNEQKMIKTQNQMLSYIVKTHYNALGNFYLTKTEPKVFWKPKKPLEDAQKTQKIKQYSQKQLKKQEEDILSKVNSFNQVFDHGKYMTQNQRQYYSNFVKNMYQSHKNFILTKTQPGVFWKPRKSFTGIEKLLKETGVVLNEKCQKLKAANIDYYKQKQATLGQDHHHKQQFSDQQNSIEQQKLE